MLVALPSTVARTRPALLASTQVVPHVVGEHSAVDQYIVRCLAAFVVDREVPPFAGHGAVVDEGDERSGNLFADPVGEDARRFGHEVCFEAMAARLMKKHSPTTGTDNHRHRP